MINWQITATTIYCDAIDDEVTLLIHKDGLSKCTGHNKYGTPDKETVKEIKGKSRQFKKQLKCEGPECYRVIQYKDKLFADET